MPYEALYLRSEKRLVPMKILPVEKQRAKQFVFGIVPQSRVEIEMYNSRSTHPPAQGIR